MSLGRLAFLVFLGMVGAGVLRMHFVEGIVIASASMEPTLPVDTHLWLDKWTLRWRDPKRGEVVILRMPVPPHKDAGKRVIAVAGDVVEIREKAVYIGDEKLHEPFAVHSRAAERLVGDNFGPKTVPEGHIFVLGDNRDESNDSAVWESPFVPISDVRGLVRGVY